MGSRGDGGTRAGNGGGLHAVVVLTEDEPTEVVMVFPSAAASIVWAKDAGLDDYRVVPASFGVSTRAPLPR